MIHLENDRLRLSVFPEFGGSWGSFEAKHPRTQQWINIFRNSGSSPSLDTLALFPMAPHVGRIRDRIFEGTVLRHPETHAIHGVLRRRALRLTGHTPTNVSLQGELLDSEEMTVVSPLRVQATITLVANAVEYQLEIANTGDRALPASIGLHMMCLKDPFHTGEMIQVRHDARQWYPPAQDLPVPEGALCDLPRELTRSSFGLFGPNWDFCTTGLSSPATVALRWPESGCTLVLSDLLGTSSHLQLWHGGGPENTVCAAELQTDVADSFRHAGKPGFHPAVLQPGGKGESSTLRISQQFSIMWD